MTYGVLKTIIAALGLLIALAVFGFHVYKLLWSNLRMGQASQISGNWTRRIGGLFKYVGGQWRLFRLLLPGTAHFFIFWGFIVLALTILQAILEGLLAAFNPHFVLPWIGSFGPLALLQDGFAVVVILAVLYALFVRLVEDPERYQGSHKGEGVLVLTFIFLIMVSLLVMNGIRINSAEDLIPRWRPISAIVGQIFGGLEPSTQVWIEEIAYWIHLGVVLVFLTLLPGGKHFHVVTSLPAVFLRNLDPPGRLPPAPEIEGEIGVSQVEHFRWRQMLDFYTCTECGRCQEVCPAYTSGLPLSPKLLMMDLRDHLIARGELIRAGNTKPGSGSILVGDAVREATVWACSTCLACDDECPLFIEHVTPIVDIRRHLVMEGRIDEMLQQALDNFGRYGNSFGQSERARAKWTRALEMNIKDARKEPVEYLWFVGDYASYNVGLSDITRMAAEVFQRAGLDFGILYEGERNAGNDVRRIGEEGLFEMLVEENMSALRKAKYNAIVTTDPHTYNTLKNEYPGENGKPVFHYTELLDSLIASGDLPLSRALNARVTYQDPCYLGRYNGIYAEPRRLIRALGCELVEMPRHHDRALCCGAGGGRIWMEEGVVDERPAEARVNEAVALDGVEVLVTACPKDVTMFRDAIKTTGHEDRILVKELIELVHEAM